MKLGFRQCLLFTLTIIASACFAQGDFLVTLQGDTLAGKVKLFTFDRKLDRVQVVTGGKKRDFTALEVRLVQYDNETYVTQRSTEGFKFMKELVKGYLSLYAFKPENQNTYSGRQLIKLDGSGLEAPNLRFRALMADFLADCPDVSEQVKNGDLGRTELEKIVDEYNKCIADMPVTITEEKGEISEAGKEKLGKVKELRSALSKLDDFEGKGDAMDLINDIYQKLRTNQAIPNYQKEALREMLGNQDPVKELLESVLKALNDN